MASFRGGYHQQNNKRSLYTSFGDSAGEPSQYVPKKMKRQLEEADVFITEFVNKDCKGFSGIIKHRYSDFIVNEIDLDGNIVRLTNQDPPAYPSESDKPDIDEEMINALLTEKDTTRIKEIAELPENKKECYEIDVTNFNKEQRKYLHKYIQLVSNNALNSNTVVRPGDLKIIEINNRKKGRQDMRRTNASRIKFLHFTVTKTNTDNSEMLFLLGKLLSRKVNKFTIAGSKDKRAITTQQVSCKYLNYADIRHVKLHKIKLGNFAYKDHGISLGDLKGNRFRLAIRTVTESDENIHQVMQLVKENGFINYFGMQRFGNNPEASTHAVGLLLLQDNWRGAVALILRPGPVGGPAAIIPKIQKIEYIKHKYFETRNAKVTLRGIDEPGFLKSSIEARILQGLARHGENAYLNALESINRNMATLYLHAYQSCVWNRIVSMRIRKFGHAVLVGDLIVESADAEKKPDEKVAKEEAADEDEDEENAGEEEQLFDIPSARANVRPVTEADLAAGTVSIADVVYPSPGFDVKLPENEVGTWYHEILKEDNLTLESFRKKIKLFSMAGSYRRIIIKCLDMTWRIANYDAPDDELQLSDACMLEGRTLQAATTLRYKAVLLELTLPPGVYVTMALREVLKCPGNQQTGLNRVFNSAGSEAPPILRRTADGDIDY